MNISKVIPKDDYILYVIAENGDAGIFDIKPYLDSEAFSPLKDKKEFKRIRNGKYFVEWDCGADLSADTIEARWKRLPIENMQTSADAPQGRMEGNPP